MLRTTVRKTPNSSTKIAAALPVRWLGGNSSAPPKDAQGQAPQNGGLRAKDAPMEPEKRITKPKTMAELDDEIRAKMSGLSGDGGEAGIEYEDGKPVAMKRSVKNNMFRYI